MITIFKSLRLVLKDFFEFLLISHSYISNLTIKKTIKTDNKEMGFYLLHLPWDVLIEEAERLKLKVPLKVYL